MCWLRPALLPLVALLLAACSNEDSEGHWHTHPNDVVFVNSDVQHFWDAHAALSTQQDPEQRLTALQDLYFDRGTEGLTTYAREGER